MLKCLLVAAAALGFLLTAAGVRTLVPWPRSYGLRAKVEWYEAHRDQYDTLFFGSSHVHRSIVPAVFDAELGARGLESRSFNFGVPGMGAFEMDLLIDAALEPPPARLKRVFVEAQSWRPGGNFSDQESDLRAVHWHTLRNTAAVLAAVRLAEPSPSAALAAAARHLKLFLLRASNFGQIGEIAAGFFADTGDYLEPGDLAERAGYQDPEAVDDPEFHAKVRRFRAQTEEFAKMVAEVEAANRMPVDTARLPFDALERQQERIRATGALLLYVVPAALGGAAEARALRRLGAYPPEFLDYNSPDRFPGFYRVDRRFDRGHLNRRGAEEFSRRLAADAAPFLAEGGR